MIPPFNEDGYRPAGAHAASVNEIAARFGGQSEIRRVQMESVRWMIDLAVQIGVLRIVLNGSFVTDIMEPNDVDCVLLIQTGVAKRGSPWRQLRKGLPFLELRFVGQREFDDLVHDFFATDRDRKAKGMIEVRL